MAVLFEMPAFRCDLSPAIASAHVLELVVLDIGLQKVYNPPADYHERAAENIYDDTVMTTIKTIIPISIVLVGYLIMRHLGVA